VDSFSKELDKALRILSSIFELNYCGCFNLHNACDSYVEVIEINGEKKNVLVVKVDSESG